MRLSGRLLSILVKLEGGSGGHILRHRQLLDVVKLEWLSDHSLGALVEQDQDTLRDDKNAWLALPVIQDFHIDGQHLLAHSGLLRIDVVVSGALLEVSNAFFDGLPVGA